MKVSKRLDTGGWQNKSLLAQRILSLSILLQGIGLFIIIFRMHRTNFGSFMFMVMKIDNANAVTIEGITISIYLGFCILNTAYSKVWILVPITLYIFLKLGRVIPKGGIISVN